MNCKVLNEKRMLVEITLEKNKENSHKAILEMSSIKELDKYLSCMSLSFDKSITAIVLKLLENDENLSFVSLLLSDRRIKKVLEHTDIILKIIELDFSYEETIELIDLIDRVNIPFFELITPPKYLPIEMKNPPLWGKILLKYVGLHKKNYSIPLLKYFYSKFLELRFKCKYSENKDYSENEKLLIELILVEIEKLNKNNSKNIIYPLVKLIYHLVHSTEVDYYNEKYETSKPLEIILNKAIEKNNVSLVKYIIAYRNIENNYLIEKLVLMKNYAASKKEYQEIINELEEKVTMNITFFLCLSCMFKNE